MNRIATVPGRKHRGKVYVGELLPMREAAARHGFMAFTVREITATHAVIEECSPYSTTAYFPR